VSLGQKGVHTVPFPPTPRLSEERTEGEKSGNFTLVSLYTTEFQPCLESLGKRYHQLSTQLCRTGPECSTLERHSFSERTASAGELLHTPERMSTFMTTDPL